MQYIIHEIRLAKPWVEKARQTRGLALVEGGKRLGIAGCETDQDLVLEVARCRAALRLR